MIVKKKETAFEKMSNKMQASIKEEKQKKLNEKKELERTSVIIKDYLEKLCNQLEEKGGTYFWTFPWKSGFKKMYITKKEIETMIKATPDKYCGKTVAYFAMQSHHKGNPSSFKELGIWFNVRMSIFHIDDDCKLLGKNKGWGCHFCWTNEDFKTTKFSFKLLETIMNHVNKKVITCESLTGVSVSSVIKRLEKKGVEFDKHPLAKV
jgi:hypothetical protein